VYFSLVSVKGKKLFRDVNYIFVVRNINGYHSKRRDKTRYAWYREKYLPRCHIINEIIILESLLIKAVVCIESGV
jgi:hypothetical protein